MQVKVNGKSIPVFGIDTRETFLRRVADVLKSSPRFLAFSVPVTMADIRSGKTTAFQAQDFRSEVQSLIQTGASYAEFKDRVAKYVDMPLLDLIKFFVLNNRQLRGNADGQASLTSDIQADLPGVNVGAIVRDDETLVRAEQKDRTYKSFSTKLSEEVAENRSISAKFLAAAQAFDSLAPFPSEGIRQRGVVLQIPCDFRTISFADLFNCIPAQEPSPLVMYNGMVKLASRMDYRQQQLMSVAGLMPPDSSRMVILKYGESTDLSDLATVLIQDSVIDVQLTTSVTNHQVFVQDFLAYLADATRREQYAVDMTSYSLTNLIVETVLPDLALDKVILADFVLVDPMASMFFAIQESVRAHKVDESINLYFPVSDSRKHVAVNLFPVQTGTSINQRVRMECRDMAEAEEILIILQKLMTRYVATFKDTLKNYTSVFGDRFVAVAPVPIAPPADDGEDSAKSNPLGKLEPDIFKGHAPTYPRQCSRHQQPIILTDDQAAKEIAAGKSVMRFPKENVVNEKGKPIPPRNYACPNPDFPYPGLKNIKTPKIPWLPYVPCCYKKDQITDRSSTYSEYMLGDSAEKSTKDYQVIYKTKKFAPLDMFGYLPANIDRLFSLSRSDRSVQFLRKGMRLSTSSLIECCLEARVQDGIPRNASADARRQRVNEQREQIGYNVDAIRLGLQHNPGMTVDDIQRIILEKKDGEYVHHLSPANFGAIVGAALELNVIATYSDETHPAGEFLYPRTRFANVPSTLPYDQTIFVYEHMGAESDVAQHPMCELVVSAPKEYTDPVKLKNVYNSVFMFRSEDEDAAQLAQSVTNFYLRGSITYCNRRAVRPLDITMLPFNTEDLAQQVDEFGKTRILIVRFRDTKVVLEFEDPIANLDCPVVRMDANVQLRGALDGSVFEDFMREHPAIRLLQVFLLQDKIVGAVLSFAGIRAYVRVSTDPSSVEQYPKVSGATPFRDETSEMSSFVQQRRIAAVLEGMFMYMLSEYMQEHDEMTISNTLLWDFVTDRVLVDSGHEYAPAVSPYIQDNRHYLAGDRLILPNKDMVNRLAYLAQLMAMRNPETIRLYHQQTFVPSYFKDILDYDATPMWTVYSSVDNMLEAMEELPRVFAATAKITPVTFSSGRLLYRQTCFLKNPLVYDNRIVKLDLVDSFEDLGPVTGVYVYNGRNNIVLRGYTPTALVARVERSDDADLVPLAAMRDLLKTGRAQFDDGCIAVPLNAVNTLGRTKAVTFYYRLTVL